LPTNLLASRPYLASLRLIATSMQGRVEHGLFLVNLVAGAAASMLNLKAALKNSYASQSVLAWPQFHVEDASHAVDPREAVIVWKNIAPLTASDSDLEAAANALYDAAAACTAIPAIPLQVGGSPRPSL
jgi:hypothetical protein